MDQNFISIKGGFRLLLDRSVIAGPGDINDCKNGNPKIFDLYSVGMGKNVTACSTGTSAREERTKEENEGRSKDIII